MISLGSCGIDTLRQSTARLLILDSKQICQWLKMTTSFNLACVHCKTSSHFWRLIRSRILKSLRNWYWVNILNFFVRLCRKWTPLEHSFKFWNVFKGIRRAPTLCSFRAIASMHQWCANILIITIVTTYDFIITKKNSHPVLATQPYASLILQRKLGSG